MDAGLIFNAPSAPPQEKTQTVGLPLRHLHATAAVAETLTGASRSVAARPLAGRSTAALLGNRRPAKIRTCNQVGLPDPYKSHSVPGGVIS